MHIQCRFHSSLSLSSWNMMIQSYTRNKFYQQALNSYTSMLRNGFHGNNFTFPFVAKACAKLDSLQDGKKIHTHVLLLGFERDVYVQTGLIDMYSKCGSLGYARQVFDEMPVRGLVSWNSMISGYFREFRLEESFRLLNQMRIVDIKPNSSTLVSLVSGCHCSDWVDQGVSIHCYAVKLGYDSDLLFLNSIITMYIRFDLIGVARALFDAMVVKSIVSWTVIVGGYVKIGELNQAFELFNQMQSEQAKPDSITFITLISGCAHIEKILIGRSVHASVIKYGYDREEPVANSIVTMYTRCHDLESAHKIFDSMPKKTSFLWTSMITGYVNNNSSDEALVLFQHMLRANVRPNEITISAALLACANSESLSMGREIEEYASRNGFETDMRVQTSLIHMYCKCGSLERAREIFDRVPDKDLAVWSSMITGYALHGKGEEALSLFSQMKQVGIKPDDAVFTSVLSACSHSGFVEDGLRCFSTMQKDFNIQPRIEHYSCMVDLLGRAGHLNLAWKTIEEMPVQANAAIWASLLSSCRTHFDVALGELAAERLLELEPRRTGNYVLLSNIYASVGKWKEAEKIRLLMKDRGLVKESGWSKV